jgi:hypothetical protein
MRAYFRILSQFTLSLMVVIPLGMLLFPSLARPLKSPPNHCQSNLKQLAIGMFQYTQDYDEKHPIVKASNTNIDRRNAWGWADALRPYVKSNALFHCPLNPHYRDKKRPQRPQSSGYTDYFYNSRLAGKKSLRANVIILAEGDDGTGGTNARYAFSALPSNWRKDLKSPSYRHSGGAYYATYGGNVAWLTPEVITNRRVAEGEITFAVK